MPIRNVSSEKEKLKLATIFFHAGSRCLPFSLPRCISISVALMLRHCFISFFAHFSLEMSRRAFMSCAPLPQTQCGKGQGAAEAVGGVGTRTPAGQIAARCLRRRAAFNLRDCVRHILSECVLRVESSLNSLPVPGRLCLLKHIFFFHFGGIFH